MSATAAAQGSIVRHAGLLDRLRHRPLWLVVAGFVAVLLVSAAGVFFGTVAVSPADTIAILGHRLLGIPATVSWPASAETIVFELRLPRVLMALSVGAALFWNVVTSLQPLDEPASAPDTVTCSIFSKNRALSWMVAAKASPADADISVNLLGMEMVAS